jgi:hypothetical protein
MFNDYQFHAMAFHVEMWPLCECDEGGGETGSATRAFFAFFFGN